MSKEIDVLDMIVRFVLPLELLLRFTRMDAFENAEAPEEEHRSSQC
jgi:hypothetical protein